METSTLSPLPTMSVLSADPLTPPPDAKPARKPRAPRKPHPAPSTDPTYSAPSLRRDARTLGASYDAWRRAESACAGIRFDTERTPEEISADPLVSRAHAAALLFKTALAACRSAPPHISCEILSKDGTPIPNGRGTQWSGPAIADRYTVGSGATLSAFTRAVRA